jgi:hypothetical protein
MRFADTLNWRLACDLAYLNLKISRNSFSMYIWVVHSGHALVHFFVAALLILRVG